MTTEQKAKAYDEALKRARKELQACGSTVCDAARQIFRFFPELKESEDERIRKEILELVKQSSEVINKQNQNNMINWLEKQGKEKSWKPSKEEMDVLYGLAYITNQYDEHKEEVITRLYQDLKREFFNGSSYENMFPTNTSTEDDVRRRSTIQVLEYARSLDAYNQFGKADIDKNIAWLEKQDEQKPADKVEPKFKVGDLIRLKDGDGLEWTIKEMHHDGYYTIVCEDRDDFIYLDDRWELVGKLVDKNEPKFKVKYAGREYNVLEIKEIAGVTYYGIEDEPNHIDYILPDNCEIVRVHGYGVKENGSPYPTKSAIFSEQKPAWSEEDEVKINRIVACLENLNVADNDILLKDVDWLKSLKQRIGWKPSEEQIQCLYDAIEHYQTNGYPASKLNELYEQMSKIYKL